MSPPPGPELLRCWMLVDLDVAGEGFAVTCSDEEALKLVEDSAATTGHIVDMLGVDMSLG
jgi:hypothetical protein